MIKINLEFDKTLDNLVGNSFGVQTFKDQVKEVLYDEKYVIVFPKEIANIATSFIQGFFQKFVEMIGIPGIDEKVEILSSVPNIKQLIIDCLVS